MDDAHFPIGTKEPMLTVGARPRTNGLFCCPKYSLSIIGMDHVPYFCNVKGAHLWRQPKDAIGFLRPNHLIRLNIPYPVADVSDELRLFEPILAFLQISRQSMASVLCALQIRNVLNGTEQPVGLSRCPVLQVTGRRAPE